MRVLALPLVVALLGVAGGPLSGCAGEDDQGASKRDIDVVVDEAQEQVIRNMVELDVMHLEIALRRYQLKWGAYPGDLSAIPLSDPEDRRGGRGSGLDHDVHARLEALGVRYVSDGSSYALSLDESKVDDFVQSRLNELRRSFRGNSPVRTTLARPSDRTR